MIWSNGEQQTSISINHGDVRKWYLIKIIFNKDLQPESRREVESETNRKTETDTYAYTETGKLGREEHRVVKAKCQVLKHREKYTYLTAF